MFIVNAAFVMILLAVGMSRVPTREWFSTAIVVFFCGMVAVACEPRFEDILRGGPLGRISTLALVWVLIGCGLAVRTTWRDFRDPPDRGSPGRARKRFLVP